MYGNASLPRSASVTAPRISRALGPQRPSAKSEPVRSVMRTRSSVPDLPPHPGEIVLPAPAARHHAEQLLALAGDRQVTPDPATSREHRRVDDRAHRAVDPVRADPLEVRERVGPLDVELRERRQVEQRRVRTRREVLGAFDRRPELRGPTVPARPRSVGGHESGVRLEPLGALPPRTGDELGAELAVPLVEGREPELPRAGHLLARMEDVVHLPVLLLPALEHVGRRRHERVEAVGIGLGHVDRGLAAHDPLGDVLAEPAGVRHPHGLADPHAPNRRRLPDDRARVRREREHPVDRALGVGRPHPPLERREEACGLGLGDVEVGGRERHQRGHRTVAGPAQRLLGRDDRFVPVAPDGVVVLPVAEVHRHVLVPQDRVGDLSGLALEPGDRIGPHELVLHRDERDRHTRHRADGRAPDAGAQQHAFALDVPSVGPNAVHAPVADVEPGHGHAAFERHAVRLGASRERRGDRHRLGDPVRGHVVRPEDRGRVEQRDLLRGLGGGEQLGPFEPVRAREPEPALQLLHPSRRRGDLDPARRRTSPVRRRRPASRRARPTPGRSGTSSASRWSGTRAPARASSNPRSRTAVPGRAPARRARRARRGGRRRSRRRSRRRRPRFALDPASGSGCSFADVLPTPAAQETSITIVSSSVRLRRRTRGGLPGRPSRPCRSSRRSGERRVDPRLPDVLVGVHPCLGGLLGRLCRPRRPRTPPLPASAFS